MADPSHSSAMALAAALRAREIRSTDLVESAIQAVEAINPQLRAVVAERFEQAREEARQADAALDRGQGASLGPLHGVPCTIKECFALEGMPQSAGLVARRDFRATRDATAVRRWRDAGAIPIGVTNTSELCMWMESANKVYGRTNNPYDTSRIVGGSSGGEGAIVGSGASPFGLGSDIGGSIRMPAFFNGVFGHKPTGGWVPGSGQYPIAAPGAARYLTTGPITRRAEDLWPLLELLVGPDGEDPGCYTAQRGRPEEVSLRGMRVIVVRDNGRVAVHQELQRAMDRAAAHLAAEGAHVEEKVYPGLYHSLEIWGAMLAAGGGDSFASMLADGRAQWRLSKELLRYALGRSEHTLPALGLAAVEKLPELLPSSQNQKAIARGVALREEIEADLGSSGVLLYPPYATVAPKHGRPLLAPWRWVYTAIWNALEMPATQVPMGLNDQGLPTGVQVVGRRDDDHRTVAVAMALERGCGGWIPPARRDA